MAVFTALTESSNPEPVKQKHRTAGCPGRASDKVAGRGSAAVPAASSGSVPLPDSSGRLLPDSDSRPGTVRELAGADACVAGSSGFVTDSGGQGASQVLGRGIWWRPSPSRRPSPDVKA